MLKQHTSKFLMIATHCKQQIKETNVLTVQQRIAKGEKLTIIDVREDSEWDTGHLPGAMHLSKGIIENMIPDDNREIILYCSGGYRSAIAAASLQQMGYRNATSIEGGLKAWVAQGFPLED